MNPGADESDPAYRLPIKDKARFIAESAAAEDNEPLPGGYDIEIDLSSLTSDVNNGVYIYDMAQHMLKPQPQAAGLKIRIYQSGPHSVQRIYLSGESFNITLDHVTINGGIDNRPIDIKS